MILPTLEKYELFQYIKSTEQLFTFVVLAFCQLSALRWLSKPMAKGAEEGVWQEVTRRQSAVRWPWGATEPQPVFPAAFTFHRSSEGKQGYVRKWEHTAAGKGEQQHSSGPLN